MKSYKDMFGNNDKKNSTSGIRGSKDSKFDMFSINVKKAKRDVSDVFDFAKSQLSGFEKINKQSVGRITNVWVSGYKDMYVDLSKQHASYLDDVIRRETEAARRVNEIWGSVNRNGNGSSGSSMPSFNNFSSNMGGSSSGGSGNNLGNLGESIEQSSSNISDAAQNMSNSSASSAKSFSASAAIISSAAKVLLAGVQKFAEIWIDRFFDGMDNIVNTYEDTYTKVSSTMNINQSKYMTMQSDMLSDIKANGLDNNIRLSTVMKELESVVSLGVTGEEARNKALSDSITKTLNPYLETTSDAYTDLQTKLGDKFVTTMQGMAEATRQSAGSNRFMQRNINDILTSMEPIVLNAKSDYADRVLGPMVQKLEAAVENGTISMADAENIKQNIVDLQLNPYNALTSDNLGVAITAQTAASRGTDFTDSNELLDIYAESMSNLTSGLSTSGAYNQISKGAVYSAYGFNTSMWNDESKFEEVTSSLDTISSYTKGLEKIENYSKDQYNTAKQQKDIWAENQTLWLAQFKEQYPDAYAIMESMLSTLMSILGALGSQAIGNLLGNLLGKGLGNKLGGSMGKGLMSSLGTKVSSGLSNLGGGLLNAGGGSVGSGLAVIGGSAAGLLMAAQGGYYISDGLQTLGNRFESDDNKHHAGWEVAGGTTAVVGGVGGAAALVALGASNPIGWVALGIAALGLTVAAVNKNMKEYNASLKASEELHNKYINAVEESTDAIIQMDEALPTVTTENEDTGEQYQVQLFKDMSKDDISNLINNYYWNLVRSRNSLDYNNEDDIKDFLIKAGYTEDSLEGQSIGLLRSLVQDVYDQGQEQYSVDSEIADASRDAAQLSSGDTDQLNEEITGANEDAILSRFKQLANASGGDRNSEEYKKAKGLAQLFGATSEQADTYIDNAINDRDIGFKPYSGISGDVDTVNQTNRTANEKYGTDTRQLKDSSGEAEYITALSSYIQFRGKQLHRQMFNEGLLDSSFDELDSASERALSAAKTTLNKYLPMSMIENDETPVPSIDDYIREYLLLMFEKDPSSDALSKRPNPFDYSVSYDNLKKYTSGFYKVFGHAPGYATGISYVHRGEIAQLHEGEAVLTAPEAREYRTATAAVSVLASLMDTVLASYEDITSGDIEVSNTDENSDVPRSDVVKAINRLIELITNSSNKTGGPTNNNLLSKPNGTYNPDLIGLLNTTRVRG